MNATHLISNTDRAAAMYSSTPQDDEINPGFALREALPTGISAQSSLFAQLRNRYPTGALTSELVQVHENQFVVRASVQVGGATLATGMAAADRIEVAEDRARIRAMEILGIVPLAPASVPSSFEMQAHLMAPPRAEISGSLESISFQNATTSSIEEKELEPASMHAPKEIAPPKGRARKQELPPAVTPQAPSETDDFLSPFPGLEPSRPAPIEMDYDHGEDFEPEATPVEVAEPIRVVETTMQHDPIDLSDAIAQIGTEIERIGWTKKQGSTYLQQTYGKKTRAELTEDELLEFLHYLKALPSKGHPSLSPIPF